MNRGPDAAGLAGRPGQVYWLGGGSGAGKSTIAQSLAQRHGLRLYATDAAMADHASRCTADDCPLLDGFKQMSMDERWVARPPEVMLEMFPWFKGEGFHLIIEDLLALPADQPVIVEGFRLLPRYVQPLLARPEAGLWLIPTPAFRAAAFKSRGTLRTIAGRTSDPDRALRNLLARDDLFTRRLQEDATAAGLATVGVDTGMTEAVLLDIVERHFGL